MMATIALTTSSRSRSHRSGCDRGATHRAPPREPVALSRVVWGRADGLPGVHRGCRRPLLGGEIWEREVVVLEPRVRLGDLDEVRVAHLTELAGVGALELDLRGDAHLHEPLREREDDPRHPPGPEEADDDVDHLGAELPDVAVEETLHRAGDAVPARSGIG